MINLDLKDRENTESDIEDFGNRNDLGENEHLNIDKNLSFIESNEEEVNIW